MAQGTGEVLLMSGRLASHQVPQRGQTGKEEGRAGRFIMMGLEMQAGVRQQWVLPAMLHIFVFIMRVVGSLKGFKQENVG